MMGISAKCLRSLVGFRKIERRRQQHHKEDANIGVGLGRMVCAGFLPIIVQFWRILVLKLVVIAFILLIA
jgi:hypothetical protein